jgi:hypothetical protein
MMANTFPLYSFMETPGTTYPHTMPSGGLLWLAGFAWVHQLSGWKLSTCFHLGMLRQLADHCIAKDSNVTNV